MQWIVKGKTYEIRKFLKILGCTWHEHEHCWTTDKEDLKKRLKILKVCDSAIKAIRLQKNFEKGIDSIQK